IIGIVFVVIIGNIVAFTVYIKGVEYIGPDLGILYGFSEPITAAVAAVLIFGSKFTMWDLLGFACVFLMLAFISVGDE
ncbi:MAG: EamA family transporter, partial [Lachnospiraceae bacterium]|nr:EamA family transporter [Lachnospiraceae bacterium]